MTMIETTARGAIRAANITGRGLRRLGIKAVSLDERSLLDAARRETGLHDFGGGLVQHAVIESAEADADALALHDSKKIKD